jgi:CreA protein
MDKTTRSLQITVKKQSMLCRILSSVLAVACWTVSGIHAEEIGSVDTAFKLIGTNHKIVIEAFDDPRVPGATCYVSRAKKGGVSGALGLAEDPSDASLACRQTGPISLPPDILSGESDGEKAFQKGISVLFKTIQVVRFYDAKRHVLIYLVYSDKLIDGSPKNNLSAIPIVDWQPIGLQP